MKLSIKKTLILSAALIIIIVALSAILNRAPKSLMKYSPNFSVINVSDKSNLIRLLSPLPNQSVTSPLVITGEARGNWFFEASFPVFLTDWDGRIIAQGIATAKSEWMTTEFVPFEATLTFSVDKAAYSNRGTLILKKDNPSGLPEHDDALEIPLQIAGDAGVACTMEAKLCPDGSGVGRTGPNCEFAKCPTGD